MTGTVTLPKTPERDYKTILKTQRCRNCKHYTPGNRELAPCSLHQAMRDSQYWCDEWTRK